MKKLILVMATVMCFGIGSAFGWTANVTFDAPVDPTYRTVVLVSEISGDYDTAYGQISKAGVDIVSIGNIKAATQYYLIAYRLTVENERSEQSDEYEFLTPNNVEPVVVTLPPLVVGGNVLNIAITVGD